jgi:hypothetical protein
MASGGGSLDQIDSKYMINEAEDIIKKITNTQVFRWHIRTCISSINLSTKRDLRNSHGEI